MFKLNLKYAIYWPFKVKKGDTILVKTITGEMKSAIIDTVLNDNFSQRYYLLIDSKSYAELGWFRRVQIKRKVVNLANLFSHKLTTDAVIN